MVVRRHRGPSGASIPRYSRGEPYHGYFFKVLTGQGPAAPLGQMDFVVNGVMIGGFALAAAPAEYGVTGVKTFMVGPATHGLFEKMQSFNPDKSWALVSEGE